ncbi:MAG: SHOCT domain-containing protein [Chloroflexi bacterium]|nr:SHOCT domain-containing protein [Chloroflexota bacterium]
MGPMGPMGPMMGGGPWAGGMMGWPALALVGLLMVALGLVVLAAVPRGVGGRERQGRLHSPEAILRERYATGELTHRQHREALVDLLKDRYVRGEIELDEYEARLGLLLGEPVERTNRQGAKIAKEDVRNGA